MKRVQTWQQRDGTHIPITAMTDSHLLNTIRMLERQANPPDIQLVGFGYWPDGEMAADSLEQELLYHLLDEDREPDPIHPSYPFLVREAEKRGLDWSED